jgi:plasmid stabilization system protein ParE
MSLPVVVRDQAADQLEAASAWWAENRSIEQAENWHRGFVDAISSLRDNAQRCPLAAENREFPFEVRELRYGIGKRPTHRALFTIRPDMVYVLLIRHLAQRPVTMDDL